MTHPYVATGGVSTTFHHTDTFPERSHIAARGPFWAECECGWQGRKYNNRVSAMVEAERHETAVSADLPSAKDRSEVQS